MSENIRIFPSYSVSDYETVRLFFNSLKIRGYYVWLAQDEILPGDDWQLAIDETINKSNVFLFFLSDSYVNSQDKTKEMERIMGIRRQYPDQKILTIPVYTEDLDSETPFLLKSFAGVDCNRQGIENLIKALSRFEQRLQENYLSSARNSFIQPETRKNLLVSTIELTNVRCFEKLTINLQEDNQPIQWAMLLGDNAAGKSTILKSIALGLCNESEATALLAEMSGSFIRQDTDECCIKVSLKEVEQVSDQEKSQDTERLQSLSRALLNAFPTPSKLQKMVRLELDPNLLNFLPNFRHGLSEQVFVVVDWAESQGKVAELIDAARRANPDNLSLKQLDQQEKTQEYTITTEIIKQSEDSEIVRKTVEPDIDFLWSDIFICGYGANRSSQTFGSYESYQASDAVKSLFSSQVHFQNPELVLLRQNPKIRNRLESLLLEVLGLGDSEYQISYTDRGIEVSGAWGRQPLEVLSDGYRTTTEWILDFIGWLVQSNRLSNSSSIGGILLIDEIEQHLHPRWQRYIVQRLREQFPQTQIIASTHTPLVASGIVDVESGILLKLDRDEIQCFGVRVIDKNSLDGKRADQILASEAFGLATTRNPGSQDKIDRYVELLGIASRTEAEEAEVQQLKSQIQDSMQPGESSTAQLIAKGVSETLQEAGESISPELLDLQINQQLQKLSRPDI
ncbi:MAG: TIR domain-containing protein [Cyanobacteria bacterium J06631_2]